MGGVWLKGSAWHVDADARTVVHQDDQTEVLYSACTRSQLRGDVGPPIKLKQFKQTSEQHERASSRLS